MATILKTSKCNYLNNCFTEFDEIWCDCAYRPCLSNIHSARLLKIVNFWKSKTADSAHLENQKAAIFLQKFGWFWHNFPWWYILAIRTLIGCSKIQICNNLSWWIAAISKPIKREISTIWPIWMKFLTILSNKTVKISKTKMASGSLQSQNFVWKF